MAVLCERCALQAALEGLSARDRALVAGCGSERVRVRRRIQRCCGVVIG